ncbi:MAG: hypothetical protein EHM19_07895 [Candidatus Latescibacterota bacterium]|nr:MAG: hypothetical protein EHM19_07895 [Candidatus Latescibacterota bacterium]
MAIGKYTPMLRKRGAYEPSFCYLMDTLLQSRIATRNESNQDFYDEDVNVYLALLLNSIVTDRFHRASSRYIAARECDLSEIVGGAKSLFTKHEIYRLNGDFLLVRTGLFTLPREDAESKTGLLSAVERGRSYYRLATSLADRIPARYRPVTEVLHKLAYDFDKYRRVLSHMRGAFLGLVEPLSERTVVALRRDLDERSRSERVHALEDLSLDALFEYRKDPSEANRFLLERTIGDLRRLEPSAWPGFALPDPNGEEGFSLQ